MQGLQRFVILVWVLAWSASTTWAQSVLPEPNTGHTPFFLATERIEQHIDVLTPDALPGILRVIHEPGAKFIRLHFSRFDLPEGVEVEVSDPTGKEVYRYGATQRDPFTFDIENGDDGDQRFWAMSISGDTAVVRIHDDFGAVNPEHHQVEIDAHIAGLSRLPLSASEKKKQENPEDPVSGIETACGTDERYDAVCWADTHPYEYGRSVPVAYLVTAQGKECTAWRVGSGNRVFTARHCIATQEELDGTEFWFNHEVDSCGGDSTRPVVKVSGGELLKVDRTLDYALLTVSDFSNISGFGYLGLDVRDGVVGESIFIPQHGLGNPKQISLESDMNDNGICQIDDDDSSSRISYMCDTVTSSSGSPVIAADTGRVIALHRLGGCMNAGSKAASIWPQVSGFFGGVVPSGDDDLTPPPPPQNTPPVARFSFSCDALSCTLDGRESYDPDGELTDFTWSLEDGGNAFGPAAEYTFAEAGTYDIELTVEDDDGDRDSVIKTVSVERQNVEPVARFSTSCVENSCSFNGAGSLDEDGSIVNWDWDLGDGTSKSGVNIGHLYSAEGTYSITLTVEDDEGATGHFTHTVKLTMPNQPPQPAFTVSCSDLTCDVNASSSGDTDGTIVSYHWDFDDGQTASGITAENTYSESGTYAIALIVEDDKGASASTRQVITVAEPRSEPIANFSASCEERQCILDAGSSTQSSADITSYQWNFGDGFEGEGQAVSHVYEKDGNYTVTLKVIDSSKASSSRTQMVKVVSAEEFVLAGSGNLSNGRATASLIWTGSDAQSVDVLRDGLRFNALNNSGKWIDTNLDGFIKSARYQLCEPDSQRCSNEVIIRFTP